MLMNLDIYMDMKNNRMTYIVKRMDGVVNLQKEK